jgi:hypothetical protein
MKKIIVLMIMTCFAFCAFAQHGVIRELSGEVELKPAGASVFSPAAAGSVVAPDTIVSTGFRSSAVIEVGSSVITVRQLTRLSLTEISSGAGTENINVNLQSGRLRVDVKPPAGTRANFNVQSPSATASVRGTTFDIDISNINVTYGSVAYGSVDGKLSQIPAGFSGHVGAWGNSYDHFDLSAAALIPSNPVGIDATGFGGGGFRDDGQGDIILDLNWQ